MNLPVMSKGTELALYRCGRDRVMHNSGAKPMVAIRTAGMFAEMADQHILGEGDTHDEAGRKAAAEFASRLHEKARGLKSWAEGIEMALKEGR